MSKMNSPLKSKVLESALDSLEEQEQIRRPRLNDEPKQPVAVNTGAPKSPAASLLSNQYTLDDDLPRDDAQAERFVTRNYSFVASIDTDIDRLRMALKQKGKKFTKQELVNLLLKERLQQLSEKGIF